MKTDCIWKRETIENLLRLFHTLFEDLIWGEI